MKKAIIITIHYVDNYGSVLQTFATQYIFDKLGYETKILDYVRENYRFPYLLRETGEKYKKRKGFLYRQPFRGALLLRWSLIYKKRDYLFSKFRNKYLHLTHPYYEYTELMENPPIAEVYVTGSDQVWNNEYNGGFLPEYFLSFAPKNSTKLAFSASFGKTKFTKEELQEMKPYLREYSGISVRESSGVAVLNEIEYSNSIHVLDPTLMLSKNEWCEALEITESFKRKKHYKDYVLLYQLNNNERMKEFSERLAKENNLKLIIISAVYKVAPPKAKILNGLSPEEFVSIINGSNYVVTDSFHGTAFSLNLHKDVYVFNPPKYSTRLASILKLVGLENRLVVDDMNWEKYPKIDFRKVDAVFETERKKAKEFIESFGGDVDEKNYSL